jgi:CDK5 regulatory subunit-associated protein 3
LRANREAHHQVEQHHGLRVQILPFKVDDYDENSNKEIDFGDTQDIDFGDGGRTIDNLEVGDIDWGPGAPEADENQDIDFSISLKESGIVVEEVGMSGGVAKDDEAFRLPSFSKLSF